MWRDALLMAGKDLRVEGRSRIALNQVLPFAVLVLVLFAFALDPSRLTGVAAGLYWLAVLFSAVLTVQSSFSFEAADQAHDQLRLSGLDPGGIFVGKASAVAVQLLVLEAVLGAGLAFLYGVRLRGALVLVASSFAATVGLAAVGTIYGALSSGARVRETLLPLLFLPVVAPVLLAATRAWEIGLASAPGQLGPWLEILVVFALVSVAVGTVAFGPVLESS
jgi:heme exporter protein B